MPDMTREDWDSVAARLQAPFAPADVDFRVQGRANEQTGRAQVVAYIDARAVQDRLDEVVGAGNWSFDWQPLVIDKGEVMIAKGTLTIHGVSKSDAGSASNFEQSLGAVSHCFKRAAVHWGIGRYLYSVPSAWVGVEKGGRIPDGVLRELRARLPGASEIARVTTDDPLLPAVRELEPSAPLPLRRPLTLKERWSALQLRARQRGFIENVLQWEDVLCQVTGKNVTDASKLTKADYDAVVTYFAAIAAEQEKQQQQARPADLRGLRVPAVRP